MADADNNREIDPQDRQSLHLETFLPYRLSVVTNRISKAVAAIYETEFGISIPEWRVMAVLGQFAPLSSNEIVDRTAMDKAKVSRAVNRLIDRGLVIRRTNPIDQRLIMLAFSRQGRSAYNRIVPLALSVERELLASLSDAQREELSDILDRLNQQVETLRQSSLDPD